LNQALALDPQNRLAEQALSDASAGGKPTLTTRTRYLAATVIAGLALLGAAGILLAALWRKRQEAARGPTEPQGQAPQGAHDAGSTESNAGPSGSNAEPAESDTERAPSAGDTTLEDTELPPVAPTEETEAKEAEPAPDTGAEGDVPDSKR
jgi:hypothetical protein